MAKPKLIERLRKMIKMAIRYEWLEKDPFVSFQQKFHHVERGFLSEEELKIVEEINSSSIIQLGDPKGYIEMMKVFADRSGIPQFLDCHAVPPFHLA